jgi:hypothetical protein
VIFAALSAVDRSLFASDITGEKMPFEFAVEITAQFNGSAYATI